jgi:hypothetical protein
MIMLLLIVLIVFDETRQCEYIVMCIPGILLYSETRRYITSQVFFSGVNCSFGKVKIV